MDCDMSVDMATLAQAAGVEQNEELLAQVKGAKKASEIKQKLWLVFHELKTTQKQLIQDKQTLLSKLNHRLILLKSQIFRRRRHMLSELWKIFPIVEFPDRKGYSICDIHLPSSDRLLGHDENMINVAVGYVGHLLMLLSVILDITLRFPPKYFGSKSLIYCTRKDQLFPLYVESLKSRVSFNFAYGMRLLNLNVVQIRALHGLNTIEPDDTLANLHGLKIMLDSDD